MSCSTGRLARDAFVVVVDDIIVVMVFTATEYDGMILTTGSGNYRKAVRDAWMGPVNGSIVCTFCGRRGGI